MTMKVAYFQPVVVAMDAVPPVQYSKMFNLCEQLHQHPELNDNGDPAISIRGGQQIQVYPNELNLDVSWLVSWLEQVCLGYMELVTQQSGTIDLTLCKPVINSVWTIEQGPGDYQEMHSHAGGHISGNIYIMVPDLAPDSKPSDCQILFRMPQTRDVTKFVMNDTWRYTPKPATMVVFPSHLPHTVYPWRGQGKRTVIAWDASLVPKTDE